MRSFSAKGLPFVGFVLCFVNHSLIASTSKIVPSGVHTGCLKGCRLAAQNLNGRRLKDASPLALGFTFDPALAE